MRIANLTRATLVAEDAREARTFAERLVGLMGRPHLPPTAGLVLNDNWVHTFWMRFPLDLVYIDRTRRVVAVQDGVPPNRICRPFWSACAVIELNAGIARATQTRVGDQLRFD